MHIEAALALPAWRGCRRCADDAGSSPPADRNARYKAALGMVLFAENRPADALAALRDAAILGDSSPPTLLNLAIAEDRAGDAARASGLMQELERRLPDWDEPPLRLAESLRARGDLVAAEKAYARVLAVNPHREEALLALRRSAHQSRRCDRGATVAVALLRRRSEPCGSLGYAWHSVDQHQRICAGLRRIRQGSTLRPAHFGLCAAPGECSYQGELRRG